MMAKPEWQDAFKQLKVEIQSLDSKIRVVAQRMRVIEKNEQIIGKTLVNHNKKLKELELGKPAVSQAPVVAETSELTKMSSEIDELSSSIKSLLKEINYNRELIDTMRQDINEMKYILDTVNPMEYVTVNQINELINEKLKKK